MTPGMWFVIRLTAAFCVGWVGTGMFITHAPTISKKVDPLFFGFAVVMLVLSFKFG